MEKVPDNRLQQWQDLTELSIDTWKAPLSSFERAVRQKMGETLGWAGLVQARALRGPLRINARDREVTTSATRLAGMHRANFCAVSRVRRKVEREDDHVKPRSELRARWHPHMPRRRARKDDMTFTVILSPATLADAARGRFAIRRFHRIEHENAITIISQ